MNTCRDSRTKRLGLPRRIVGLTLVALLANCGGRAISHRSASHPSATRAGATQTEGRRSSMPYSLPMTDRRTTEDVLTEFGPYAEGQLKPYFQQARVAYPPRELTFVALKAERILEVWARDDGVFRHIRDYRILAASGVAGPKLQQGDKQVPEGIYRIEGLNPNSKFHLSMKLNYPNEFDWAHAEDEGRDNPGSDIFIHGKDLSVGCLAMGDAAIEELFVLVAQTGRENVKVVIAPRDPRALPLVPPEESPEWLDELYRSIEREVRLLEQPVRVSSRSGDR